MTEKPAGVSAQSPWWTPARHTDIRPFLAARGAITRAVRVWFDEQGFAEVETGILQVSPGNETHLHAPRTELTGDGFTAFALTTLLPGTGFDVHIAKMVD